MKSTLFLASLVATPWAMEPTVLQAYARALGHAYASKVNADEPNARTPVAAASKQAQRTVSGAIAVIPLRGTIMPRAGMLEMCGGGTSVETFTAALRGALTDETVSQILIDIDSPGGSVYGVGELAAEIRAARLIKPVVGIANHVAASAAYWIGSACSELYMTPGGQVGSIGVIAAHEDVSAALQAEGVNVTLITAGKYKAEGNPYGPLDAEAMRSIQADIDSYYADFTGAVSKGRAVGIDAVRSDMGQGRMMRCDAAMSAKMVDGIDTIDGVIKRMQKNAKMNNRNALRAARNELNLIG
jgi:signal peptide peptidase SppA